MSSITQTHLITLLTFKLIFYSSVYFSSKSVTSLAVKKNPIKYHVCNGEDDDYMDFPQIVVFMIINYINNISSCFCILRYSFTAPNEN